MKEIKLPNNKITTVDDKDYKYLSKWKWKLTPEGYVTRSLYKNKTLRMARDIMKARKGEQVDHVDGDILDNRRSNLRVVTHQQNHFNMKIKVNNKSGYKGVSWSKLNKKWRVRIMFSYKEINLGLFLDKLEAAKAYNIAAIFYFGEYARLNKL